MSNVYKVLTLSPEDSQRLRRMHHSVPTPRLVALIHALHQKVLNDDCRNRGRFQKAADAINIVFRSRGAADVEIAFLTYLINQYGLDVIIKFIESEGFLRHQVRDNLHQGMKLNEGAEEYHGQYDGACRALVAFGIDCKDVPLWNDITTRLTPDKLALIEKLEVPQLVLVPPLPYQDLIEALDRKKGVYGIKSYIDASRYNQIKPFRNNEFQRNLAWEIWFVDGRQDIPYNEKLQYGKNVYAQVEALKAMHEQNGLASLVGERAYLSLMMLGVFVGKPIDKNFCTILNADVVAADQNVLFCIGYWQDSRICFGFVQSGSPISAEVRLRASIIV